MKYMNKYQHFDIDPFELMGLTDKSTINELEISYNRLSNLCNPDNGGNSYDYDIIHNAYLYIKEYINNKKDKKFIKKKYIKKKYKKNLPILKGIYKKNNKNIEIYNFEKNVVNDLNIYDNDNNNKVFRYISDKDEIIYEEKPKILLNDYILKKDNEIKDTDKEFIENNYVINDFNNISNQDINNSVDIENNGIFSILYNKVKNFFY